MAGRVDAVHVRCSAPARRGRAALDLQRRLAATARNHLPDALDRALRDGGRRIFADRIRVELDFDPADYDDVTVAALWAGRIERALAAAESGGAPDAGARVDGLRTFASERDFIGAALAHAAASGRLPWVFAELACGSGDVSAAGLLRSLRTRPQLVAALSALAAREELARSVYAVLTPPERAHVVAALRGERAWSAPAAWAPAGRRSSRARAHTPGTAGSGPQRARPAARAAGAGDSAARDDRAGERAPTFATWYRTVAAAATDGATAVRLDGAPSEAASPAHRAAGGPSHAQPSPSRGEPRAHTAPAAPGRAVDARREAREGARPERGAAADAAREDVLDGAGSWSHAGGLVLLYPWLRAYLEQEFLPDADARTRALVELADPGSPELARDPLVRVLAGAPLEGDAPPESDPPPELDPARVLAQFAAALPGLAESSPAFVRAHFVLRRALVEPLEGRAVRVVLEPAPLDPLLALLPYPLAPFVLPWSATIVPERRDARG